MLKKLVSISSLVMIISLSLAPSAKALTYAEIYKAQTGGRVLGSTVQTFTISEKFGVSHPDQIIDFDYPAASSLDLSNTCMIGPDGAQVPFQALSTGKIAVRTALVAGSAKTWQLQTGCEPTAAPYSDQVAVDTSNSDYIQLSNSLTGARVFNQHGQTRSILISLISVVAGVATITTATRHDLETNVVGGDYSSANLKVSFSSVGGSCSYLNSGSFAVNGNISSPSKTQFNVSVSGTDCSANSGTVVVLNTTQAPIQGMQMRDGSWSSGNNKLFVPGNHRSYSDVALNANSVTTSLLENGPLKTVVKVSYAYNLANPNTYGSTVLHPAGPAYYTSTITLEAGQPSVLIEEDTDMDLYFQINTYQQIQPDQGRYRAHHATQAAYGYEPNQPAVTCTGALSSTPHDCFRDFDYGTAITTQYYSSASSIAYSQAWNPWIFDTGWYWMIYNKSAAAGAAVLGAFEGQASRAIGSNATGFSPYFLPDDGTGSRAAGLEFSTNRRGPDNSIFPTTRYDWGIFVGTKGDANFSNPSAIQNITLQQNLHGGFNLNKIYRYQLDFSDPSSGYGRLFNDPAMIQAIINKLRNGPDAANYYNYLYNAEPYARPLVDMWKDATGAKTHAAAVTANTLSANMLNAYISGMGVYDFSYHYWHGGLAMSNQLAIIDSILADPTLSAADKAAVKADASLYSYILYDEDFVPMNGFKGPPSGNGLNAGTGNMPIQQLGYRDGYTLFMPQHPFLAQFVSNAMSYIDRAFDSQINQTSGASACSPHYTGACAEPTMISMLQAIMAGTDYFGSDVPRATRFGEFLMQLLTPPEVRFKIATSTYAPTVIPRKMAAEGDGSTEGTEMTGIAAQGFRNSNPALASRLMGAWQQGGKVNSGFFVTTLAIINENMASTDPQLKTDNFPGYMSVLRSGWNTSLENAAWLFNGDWLLATGHRHDDRGGVVLYALKAPLAVNWGSVYSPPTAGGNMQSIVMPDANFGSSGWNGDNQPLNLSSGWNSSSNDTFESFGASSMANGKMANSNGLNWERKLYSITPDTSLPLIMIKDNFSGANSTQGKVMTLNLMASGAVSTPVGSTTPAVRLNTATDGSVNAYPSASAAIALNTGINKFQFTGQTWNQHPAKGIDWDLYTVADESQQAVIGNWGHVWNPSTEASQYQKANNTSFSETQDILRVHGSSGFWTLILPYNKGRRPADLSVSQDSTTKDVVITYGGKTIRANEHYYAYSDAGKTMLTSFDSSSVSGSGAAVSGGAMEISLSSNTATLTFHGPAGIRSFTLPGAWTASGGVSGSGGSFTYNYGGGNPVIVSLSGSNVNGPDTTPPPPALPAISNLTGSNTMASSTSLSWQTNVPTNGQVFYGLTSGYGLSSALVDNSSKTTSHSITLTGLTPATLYHFKAASADSSSNSTSTSDFTFTTTSNSTPSGNGGASDSPGAGPSSGGNPGTTENTPPAPIVYIPAQEQAPAGSGSEQASSSPASLIRLKLINSKGTYYLIVNNVRRGVTLPGILFSYGFALNQAKSAAAADMQLPEGDILAPSDGILAKTANDKTVWLISGSQRRGFTSDKVFTVLGFKFGQVLTVTAPELNKLPKGDNVDDAAKAHLPGINISDRGVIYWIDGNSIRHPYPSLAVYNSWNVPNDFSRVLPANGADRALPVGETVTARVAE